MSIVNVDFAGVKGLVDFIGGGGCIDGSFAGFESVSNILYLLLLFSSCQGWVVLNFLGHLGGLIVQRLLLKGLLFINRFAWLMGIIDVDFTRVEGVIDFIGVFSGINSSFAIFERLVNIGSLLVFLRRG